MSRRSLAEKSHRLQPRLLQRRRLLLGLLAWAVPAPPLFADKGAEVLMLAGRWHQDLDPAAYWVSEKLDGVRAHWDGEVLRFRGGRLIAAPAQFITALPATALDGELWLGRGRFDELSGIVRRQEADAAAWAEVRYMLFDLPGAAGSFDARLQRLRSLVVELDLPWLQAVPQFRVRNSAELDARLNEVLAGGGEGLMLHRADAHWAAGRGDAVLKLTPWLDAEAIVTGHRPGRGRLRGMTGALEVEAPDGRRFRIGAGLNDALRRSPPPVGSLVTYRYRELGSGGLPRFPVFVRVRELP